MRARPSPQGACRFMKRSPLSVLLLAAVALGVACQQTSSSDSSAPQAPAADPSGTPTQAPDIVVEPAPPPDVAEGEIWVPPLASFDDVQAPDGWQPPGVEQPPMPITLLRLPRTHIVRAKYPAIDFHVH